MTLLASITPTEGCGSVPGGRGLHDEGVLEGLAVEGESAPRTYHIWVVTCHVRSPSGLVRRSSSQRLASQKAPATSRANPNTSAPFRKLAATAPVRA